METSELKHKTAKSLLWGGGNSAMQQIIALGVGIVLARILDKSDYGLVACLAIFSAIAGSLANCGFSTALTNKKNASQSDYNSIFWFSSLTGLALYIILFFSAPLIADYFREPELIKLSRVLFLGFLFGGIGTVSYTYLYKHLMTKQLAIADTISLIASCIVGITLALNGFKYWALAVQSVLYIFINVVIRFFICPWKPKLSFSFAPLKSMFSFSVKILLTNLFNQASNNIFSVIIGKYYGKVENGEYSNGQKWANMGGSFLSMMLGYVSQPVLAQINDDRERQLNALRKLIRFGAFISFPLLLGLASVGHEFIVIAVGEKWIESVPYLRLFCVALSFQFLITLFSNLLFTHGKSDVYMYINIATGIVQLAAILVCRQFGIMAMVASFVVVSFLSLGVWLFFVNKCIGLHLTEVLKDIIPYIAISLACFVAAHYLTVKIDNYLLLLASKILISGILYIFALRICNSVIFMESVSFLKEMGKKINR